MIDDDSALGSDANLANPGLGRFGGGLISANFLRIQTRGLG
jgi:hypothetical protein